MATEIIDAARSMNLGMEMNQMETHEDRGRSSSPKKTTNIIATNAATITKTNTAMTSSTTVSVQPLPPTSSPSSRRSSPEKSDLSSVKDAHNSSSKAEMRSPKQDDFTQSPKPSIEKPSRSRRGNKKPPRIAPLFNHLPDKTEEATKTFVILKDCTYTPKWLGESGQEDETMACECQSQFDGSTNLACGEHSDCINRMTSMECVNDDATCGGSCRNQRFQNQEYADVSVIQTEKKGYGLRTNQDLTPGTFIFEYVGEVIDEVQFRKRQQIYAEEDIKHFYFMSLKTAEFIDATKKGCLARFCNHSCNPNCMVEKWVVGEKMRMGIFAKVPIKAGEELTFDYNVDRYGADAQPCYCGETNCVGFIGGRTQTGGETKLAHLYQDALGIDEEDAWKSATSRRKKKKKTGDDDDEEYIDRNKLPELTEDDATTVMAGLIQCRERWIAVCLLTRIKKHNDQNLDLLLMRLHGYQIVNNVLKRWSSDSEVITVALEVLRKWPAITKNKITSSKIEPTIQMLTSHEDENVKKLAEGLLEHWSTLQMGYRIPRRIPPPRQDYVREQRVMSTTPKDISPKPSPEPPKGPKNDIRKPPFKPRPKPQFRDKGPADHSGITKSRYPKLTLRPIQLAMALPNGWAATENEERGIVYYNIRNDEYRRDLPFPYTNDSALPPFVGPQELRTCAESYKRQLVIDETIARAKAEDQQRRREAAFKAQNPPPPPPPEVPKKSSTRHKKPYDPEAAKRHLKKAFATVVPNYVSRYEKYIGGREGTKDHSKKIVAILVEKDTRNGREIRSFDITDEKKKKIKNFTNEYMGKVLKHLKAEGPKRQGTSQNNILGPGSSAVLAPQIISPQNASADISPKDNSPPLHRVGDAAIGASSSPEQPSPLSEETKATSTSPSVGTPTLNSGVPRLPLEKVLANKEMTRSPLAPTSPKRKREEETEQRPVSPKRKREHWDAPKKTTERTPSPKRKADEMLGSAEKSRNHSMRPTKRPRSPAQA